MERGTAELQIILLGDLIDRGPNSAGVVQRAADLAEATGAVRFLKGNHEEVFLQAAKGDVQATRFLFRFGGRETMFSYGLSEAELDQLDFEELTDWLLNHVPRAHVDFLDGFEDMVEIGDYAFRSEEHTSELQSLMRISYAVFCLKNNRSQRHKNN